MITIDGLMPRPGITNEDQLVHFSEVLATQTHRDVPTARNWTEAFCQLDETLADDSWTLVLLDEISWMGKYDPDFPGALSRTRRIPRRADAFEIGDYFPKPHAATGEAPPP